MIIPNRISLQHKYRSYVVIQRDKQRGIVLIVSLVFLIALTAVASALMLNTTTDMKMSGASEMQMVANQEAFGAMDELIFRQITIVPNQVNTFSLPVVRFQAGALNVLPTLVSTNTGNDVTTATIAATNNALNLDVSCPRASLQNTNSTNIENCNILQVQLNKAYGRTNASTVQVNAGIVQKLPKNQ
jgi:type IV pilus assembly protein PilX